MREPAAWRLAGDDPLRNKGPCEHATSLESEREGRTAPAVSRTPGALSAMDTCGRHWLLKSVPATSGGTELASKMTSPPVELLAR